MPTASAKAATVGRNRERANAGARAAPIAT
jgi:hypothetical protein